MKPGHVFARSASGLALAVGIVVAVALSAAPARAQGTLLQFQADVDQIARQARPSLVMVIASRTVVAANRLPGQPERRLHTRVGSGVAVAEDAILTTASVVLGAERMLVRTDNGLEVEAELRGMDPIFNLAVLHVAGLRLPPLRFAEGRPAQIGDWVIALGTSYRGQFTQSVGTVAYRYREPRQSLLQLTNTVYPGNSGGAALNTRGELVGIVQGELGAPAPGGRSESIEHRPGGMSFVLPVETVRPVFESLNRDGRVRHGYLGVTTRGAIVESETEPGARIPIGALVESVVVGGPSQRAGLRHGDLIVAFDGERVEYPEQLARWVATTRPGTAVSLVWVRDEIQRTGRAVLAESPEVVPPWVLQASQPTPAGGPPSRIADLEREIRRLSRELERLKSQTAPSAH